MGDFLYLKIFPIVGNLHLSGLLTPHFVVEDSYHGFAIDSRYLCDVGLSPGDTSTSPNMAGFKGGHVPFSEQHRGQEVLGVVTGVPEVSLLAWEPVRRLLQELKGETIEKSCPGRDGLVLGAVCAP